MSSVHFKRSTLDAQHAWLVGSVSWFPGTVPSSGQLAL